MQIMRQFVTSCDTARGDASTYHAGQAVAGAGWRPILCELIGRRLILPNPQTLTVFGVGTPMLILTFCNGISWQQRTCLHVRERIFVGGEMDLAASGDDFRIA